MISVNAKQTLRLLLDLAMTVLLLPLMAYWERVGDPRRGRGKIGKRGGRLGEEGGPMKQRILGEALHRAHSWHVQHGAHGNTCLRSKSQKR